MTARILLTAIIAFSFALPSYAQETKDKDQQPASGGVDGYGGDSKQGNGPGVSVMPNPEDPSEQKVPTKRARTKKGKEKAKAIEKSKEKDTGAQKSGG